MGQTFKLAWRNMWRNWRRTMIAVVAIVLGLILLFAARLGSGIAGATIATAQAVIADSTPAEKRAHGMALIGMAFGIGFTFGPLLGFASLFVDFAGAPGFAAAGLSLVALGNSANFSSMFIRLKPFEERVKEGLTAEAIMTDARKRLAQANIQDAYIVSAVRTPVGKAPRGVFRNTRPDDLLAFAIDAASRYLDRARENFRLNDLDPAYDNPSVKLVQNCERRLVPSPGVDAAFAWEQPGFRLPLNAVGRDPASQL